MSETTLKSNVLKLIKKHYKDAFIYKAADRFTSGIPDLLMCIDGKFIAIELKVKGNHTTPIQDYTLERILDAGGRTAVCYSTTEVMQFLKEVITNDRTQN